MSLPLGQGTAAYMLTESHEFLKGVLSYLSAKNLGRVARVCKCWNEEVKRILPKRQGMTWSCVSSETINGEESSHDLGHFGEDLDTCLEESSSIPHCGIMFSEFANRKQFKKFEKHGCSRKEDYVDVAIRRKLPKECSMLALTVPGTVGTDRNLQLTGETEGDGGVSCLFLPKMEGVDVRVVSVPSDLTPRNPQDQIKCILIFFAQTLDAHYITTHIQGEQRSRHLGRDTVISGAIVNQFIMPKCADSFAGQALVFSGPNVQAASILMDESIETKEQVGEELLKLKKLNLKEKKSIAFMFACVGRGTGHYGECDVESEMFKKHFPNTPLFGLFGNGEIGSTNLSLLREQKSSKIMPELIHGYSTIITLVTFE